MDKPEVSHYQQNSGGEPIEYIKAQGWLPDFASANVIKYVSRARYKGQALSDYKKARQYLDWLIEDFEEHGVDIKKASEINKPEKYCECDCAGCIMDGDPPCGSPVCKCRGKYKFYPVY